jgi:hypothetical protein
VRLHRRQLLKALGLGALTSPSLVLAGPTAPPRRIVFFVQPHGHVPSSWKMPVQTSSTAFSEYRLSSVAEGDFCPVLRPLYALRERVLAIEGLAHTAALADIATIARVGGDLNNHNVAVADLLTGAPAAQHPGSPCTGGAMSIDQVLALRTAGAGRFASRLYGGDYIPNQIVAPFSFLGPSQATPVVKDPAQALADLLGAQPPVGDRATRLSQLRLSMLDGVAEEYRMLSERLSADGRATLDAHRALVRDLETQLAAQAGQTCDLSFDPTGVKTRQFMRLIRMAFACDLTRVITYAAPVPLCPEFSYPADADVHATYAHASVPGATSCGQTYSPVAEQAMTDLSRWYGEHVAYLANELDSVKEGDGTMLDHTVIVWLTELGNPTHHHDNAFTVLIGGGSGFFKTGRYVRYPVQTDSPVPGSANDWPRIGPAHNRLLVSLMNAMAQPDTSFGTTSATSSSGEPISLIGALTELQAG